MTLDFLSALVIGLMGSGHCLVMCGGVSTMLTSALPVNQNKLGFVLAYNLGRLCSYALAGAIVGYTGAIASQNIGLGLGSLRIISGIFLILLGLYIGNWIFWLTHLERAGRILWQYLSPVSKKVLPVNSIPKALLLGSIWGWLPCGLVYSALTWSLASGSSQQGAVLMLGFGLGTLPALLSISLQLNTFTQSLKHPFSKKLMGFLLIFYGIYTVKIALRQFS